MKLIMATKNELSVPFMAIHPGSILKEELKERGIKQKDFAQLIGMRETHLSTLIKGRRNISAEVADKLETYLGISSVSWLNLQTQYDYDCRVIEKRGIEEQSASNELTAYENVFSVKTVINRLGINCSTRSGQLKKMTEELNICPAAELQLKVSGMFRKSEKKGLDEKMIATWILLSRAAAKKITVKNTFDKDRIKELIVELRDIFNSNSDTVNRVTSAFSEYGIKFGIVEKVDGASIDGYSFYDDDTPCIIVTKRYDKIDSFAFSVMHELGHVLNHLGHENQTTWMSISDYHKGNREEKEADEFASNSLIPKSIWDKAPETKVNSTLLQNTFSEWAKGINYNKWIVLGRVSYELQMYKFKDDGTRKIA
jgi:HTH-type transcriptional regulator / antitoxin HigA